MMCPVITSSDPWVECSEIVLPVTGRLWLGGWEFRNEDQLSVIGPDFTVGLGFTRRPYLTIWSDVETRLFDIDDLPVESDRMLRVIDEMLPTIYERLVTGETVYVHCHAGISRSATLVLALLIRYFGYGYESALAHVKKYRPVVQPNRGFRELLQQFEKKCRA